VRGLEPRKQVGAVSAVSASGLEVVGIAVPTAALAISAFSAISATGLAESRSPSRNTCVPLQGRQNGFPPVSAGFRHFAPSSAGPLFPKDSRFPPFPPFPPLVLRPRTSRRQSGCVVPAAATDRAAPDEASMLMNIMPILCRRRSAGISHNIAQERQAKDGHGCCTSECVPAITRSPCPRTSASPASGSMSLWVPGMRTAVAE
jgi:hypothetical protein